jgi:hypothetical protein
MNELAPARIPNVRHFIACARVERSPSGRTVSLINLLHTLRPLAGHGFPLRFPEIWLYAQMSDGLGELAFQLQVVECDSETSIRSSAPVTMDLGTDPLIVFGWPVRLLALEFPRPGLCEFRLHCNGQELAREPLRLEEHP